MNQRFLLTILFSFVSISLINAQLLNNQLGEAFTDKPYFNSTIIKENRISSISGYYTTKKSNDQLRETDLERCYFFNAQGQIYKMFETYYAGKIKDTLITYWEYDETGNVSLIRKADQYGFYSFHFTYDSLGRVTREEFRRNLSKTDSKINFQLGKEFMVSFESSKYERFPGQEKRIFYNSYDQPYREEISYFDGDGFLIEKNDRLRRTSGINKSSYFYNEIGLLDSMVIASNQTGSSTREYAYKYDSHGNLLSQNNYKNTIHITEYQIIYDRKTGLLNYILTRDMATNFITILRLDNYTFFDGNTMEFNQK